MIEISKKKKSHEDMTIQQRELKQNQSLAWWVLMRYASAHLRYHKLMLCSEVII